MLDVIAYVLLGLFLLMVPGFLFTLVLYPRVGRLDFWGRMGLSLGLGVLLLIYVGFVVAQPGLKMLEAGPFVGVVLAVCVGLAFLAYLRGGFEVIIVYKRAATRIFQKFRPPKPPSPPPAPQPEQLPEQPEERVQEQPKEQPPEQKSEGG